MVGRYRTAQGVKDSPPISAISPPKVLVLVQKLWALCYNHTTQHEPLDPGEPREPILPMHMTTLGRRDQPACHASDRQHQKNTLNLSVYSNQFLQQYLEHSAALNSSYGELLPMTSGESCFTLFTPQNARKLPPKYTPAVRFPGRCGGTFLRRLRTLALQVRLDVLDHARLALAHPSPAGALNVRG